MIRNYFISALRNMLRSKLYTAINILCLTVGITGAILISLYLNHELSYDSHHQQHASIYRLHGNYVIGGNPTEIAITPFPLGPALKQEFSEIKEYVRFFRLDEYQVKKDENEFRETRLVFADSTVFDVFSHQIIHGVAQGALSEPYTAVLGKKLSQKIFGTDDCVGQVFEVNGQSIKVTAVIEDLPDNTHLKYSGMLSFLSAGEFAYSLDPQLFWNINYNYTYVQMHPGTSIYGVLDNMDAFNEKYISPIGGFIGATAEFKPTPLRRTHFTRLNMADETGNPTTLLIFSMVALFLIIIAAVNYTNLATARAASRAREIAMRKVSGAGRRQLLIQFLSESVLVAFISLMLSLLLVEVFLPGFNALANKSFRLSHLLNTSMILQVVFITLLTGLVAGIYPAIFLSRMKPVAILKSNLRSKGGSGLLRKILVVFQFTISVLLIGGTLSVQKQLHYVQNKPLGFEKSNRLAVSFPAMTVHDRVETLENILRGNPMIVRTTKTSMIPGRGANLLAVKIQSENEMKDATITSSFIDPEYLNVMNIRLLQGRGFHADQRSDAMTSIIINEAAVRTYGWHDDPLGKIIHWQTNEQGEPQNILRVIGVVNDFHFTSLENPIDPLMMLLPPEQTSYQSIIVEYLPGSDQQVKSFVEETMRSFDPARLPNVEYLDFGFHDQFAAEEKLGNIFGIFALVCIAISFLGLFGLSSFVTSQRKKEVGIRKVLGASAWSILAMFYKEFGLLVLVAILVATPLTWYLMDRWLQGFIYRISMSMEPILISGILSIAVAIITVSYHILMASRMNPTEAIRSE